MIEINNLRKAFDEVEALKNVTLKINKGSIYGLVGSNGAGKTTLLKTIIGIYKQDFGTLLVDDLSVYDSPKVKERIFFIPDNPYFFPDFTIKNMANFYKDIYSSWNQERFIKLMDAFKIDLNKKIHKLSKGMQRQVAFWLALSLMPEYLILDEPLDGLDPVMRKEIKNLIIQDVAERDMAVLISSHNLRELEDLFDTIGILHEGILIIEKEIDALKADLVKLQVVFSAETPSDFMKCHEILYEEKRGNITLYIIRSNKEALLLELEKYEPLLLDILPLTLEEVFIYEMRDVGYEISNIIL